MKGDCSIELFNTMVGHEALHTQWYKKVSDVVCSPIKTTTSVQNVGNGIQTTGMNGYNVPFVNNGFTEHAFTFKSNF